MLIRKLAMFRARTIKYCLIAVGAVCLLVLLAVSLPGPANGDVQVFDPGLHILHAELSFGTHHSVYGNRFRTALHDLAYSYGPSSVTMRMCPSLEAETRPGAATFVLRYQRDGVADAVTGVLNDGHGHDLPLRNAGMFHVGTGPPTSRTQTTEGGLILVLDQPPTNGGDYQLVLHSVTTNIVMGLWKIHLPATTSIPLATQ